MAAAAVPKRPAADSEISPTEAGKKRAKLNAVILIATTTGPSLRSHLTRPFSEEEARGAMRQLLRMAAQGLHATTGTINDDVRCGVINPDTILAAPAADGGGDGARKIVLALGRAAPGAGEPPVPETLYCSPHQLNHSTRRCEPADDVWALGCVMFEMLKGEPLFTARTEEDAHASSDQEDVEAQEMEHVLSQTVDLHDELTSYGEEAFDHVPGLSRAGRELLAGLLAFHDGERLTAADALQHRWFTEDNV